MPFSALFAVVALVRLVMNLKNRGSGKASRKKYPARWYSLVWGLVAPLTLILLGVMLGDRRWGLLPVVAALTVVLFPWPLVRGVLVPLGLFRCAFVLTHLAFFTWCGELRGGAAFAAALALARRRRPKASSLAWVEAKLARPRVVRAADFGAAGLLAAARGDVAGARELMLAASQFVPSASARYGRESAAAWLAAEAASRSDWASVLQAGMNVGSRRLWLLRGLGLRLTGATAAGSRVGLWFRWLLAPRRRRTWRFVLAAVRRPVHEPRPTVALTSPQEGAGPGEAGAREEPLGALGRALRLHLRLPSTGAVPGGSLVETAQAWETVLASAALRRGLAERAMALGTVRVEGVLSELQGAIEADLAALTVDPQHPAAQPEAGALLERVVRQRREQLLSTLELAAERLQRRVKDGRELRASDEWREFAALKRLHETAAALGGEPTRRLAYAALKGPACSHAVWLFNIRQEKPLANIIFRWLLTQAELAGDIGDATVQRKNVACGAGP